MVCENGTAGRKVFGRRLVEGIKPRVAVFVSSVKPLVYSQLHLKPMPIVKKGGPWHCLE